MRHDRRIGFDPLGVRPYRDLATLGGSRRVRHLEGQLSASDGQICTHQAAIGDAVLKQPESQGVLEIPLDGTLERSSPVRRVVPLARQEVLGGFAHQNAEADLRCEPLDAPKLQVDDPLDQVERKRTEDDHVVHSVKELGAEMMLELAQDIVLEQL